MFGRWLQSSRVTVYISWIWILENLILLYLCYYIKKKTWQKAQNGQLLSNTFFSVLFVYFLAFLNLCLLLKKGDLANLQNGRPQSATTNLVLGINIFLINSITISSSVMWWTISQCQWCCSTPATRTFLIIWLLLLKSLCLLACLPVCLSICLSLSLTFSLSLSHSLFLSCYLFLLF